MGQQLIRLHLEDTVGALALFRTIINHGTGYREALQLVAERPDAALMALQNVQTELTPQGAAKILEEVVAVIPNTAAAVKHLNDHLSTARQVELLAARSDLDSGAAEIMDIAVILQAVHKDFGDSAKIQEEDESVTEDGDGENVMDRSNLVRAAYVARSWARKLRHRADYQTILDAHMVEGFTFRECLLIVLANETLNDSLLRDEESPEEPDLPMDQSMFGGLADEERLVSDEAFEAVGLDADQAMGQLRDLLESKRLVRFRTTEIEAAQAEREETRQAQLATAEAARDTAAAAADKVEF